MVILPQLMGTLFIVSTPIGNLQDITLRGMKTLFDVDVIACEDTRKTGLLLDKLRECHAELVSASSKLENKILNQVQDDNVYRKPRLLSYYDQNELRRIPEITALLQDGVSVALVSDAGTPAVSDPGFKLIRECAAQGIRVEAVPGASSILTAVVVSGLPTDKFIFVGYPPHKSGHRMKFFENIKTSQEYIKSTVILFEAPHKLLKTLENLQTVMGDIPIVLCRELTKIYEEVRRETISEALAHFKKTKPKGEFVILFHL